MRHKSFVLFTLLMAGLSSAQQATAPSPIVPQLVNFSGRAVDAQGKVVAGTAGITFTIYSQQYEGVPLWLETQNVQPDSKGNYTVQLGATKSDGLPLQLFSSGEARWLGVRVNGGEEQPRVLLLSVPYALKAADAETVGGLPPSAFVLAAPAASGSATPEAAASSAAGVSPVGGSGTQNYIPIWTDSSGDLGNSVMFQLGTGSSAKIGINEKNPLETLDVNGSELVRGLMEMATMNYATPTKGYNSQPFNLESSAYNSGTAKYTLNHFQWQAEPVGNNTTSPGATLNLLYGTDPANPTETGLKLSSAGIFTFAPGQTFPGGGGTVTSVGLSAPSSDFTVSGSPVTTSGTLGLSWTVAPTNADTANAIVKRDATGAFSSGEITASASTTKGTGLAVNGGTDTGHGIGINVSGGLYAVEATTTQGDAIYATSSSGSAVAGISGTGSGVYGQSTTLDGVAGYALGSAGYGVSGFNSSDSGTGVFGYGVEGGYFEGYRLSQTGGPGALLAQGASNLEYNGEAGAAFYGGDGDTGFVGGAGMYAYAGNPGPADAGVFFGNVDITGSLTKGGGSFKIDDPLDPANKYLYHSFVESPDMMNVYNGNIVLNGNGEATVQLPEWFETLNRDFRYQLTSIGGFAPIYVAQKVQNNAFKIAGGKPGMEVSWQVTGVRQDAWANAHRIPVEVDKPARERGYYLHPELYGQPQQKGIAWALHPEGMRFKQQRHRLPSMKPAASSLQPHAQSLGAQSQRSGEKNEAP
jgi:hypothetical protein